MLIVKWLVFLLVGKYIYFLQEVLFKSTWF